MRRWSELAERLAATTRTSEKTALLADYLRTLTPRRAADRGRLPHRPAVPGSRPARGRARLVGDRHDRRGARRRRPRPALGEAYDRHSDLGLAVADVLTRAGHAPAGDRPDAPRGGRRVRGDRGGLRPGPQVRHPRATLLARSDPLTAKYIVKVLGGELRIGLREGLLEAAIAKAFDRPLDDVKWAGHAHRRRRAARRPGPRRPPRRRRADPVPPAQVHARLAGRGRRRDRQRAWDPRSGSRTSTTGSAPSSTSRARRSGSSRATSTTSPASSRRSSVAAETLPWDGILDGEILAWKDGAVLPFVALQTRLGRKTPSAEIQAQVPVIFVAFDALALGPGEGRARSSRCCATPLTERRQRLDALDLPTVDPAAGSPARNLVGRRRRGRARGGLHRRAVTAQRGPDGQGPRRAATRPAGAASAG